MKSAALLLALAVLCSACGDGRHVLEGSVSELFDLRYETVFVDQTADDIAVRFVRKIGTGGEDTLLKITWAYAGETVVAPVTLDLAEPRPDNGAQRGVISRNVLADPRRTFPKILRGNLALLSALTPNGTVSGRFNATFENGSDPASGRTVFGSFDATVNPVMVKP